MSMEYGPKKLINLTNYEVLNNLPGDKLGGEQKYIEVSNADEATHVHEVSSFTENPNNKGNFVGEKIKKYYIKNN